jgi:hypothetical protein
VNRRQFVELGVAGIAALMGATGWPLPASAGEGIFKTKPHSKGADEKDIDRTINERLKAAVESGDDPQQVLYYVNMFVRQVLYEQSFFLRLLPPQNISHFRLNRDALANKQFVWDVQGRPFMHDLVTTPRYVKDISGQKRWPKDMRKLLRDGAVGIARELDGKFMYTVNRLIAEGGLAEQVFNEPRHIMQRDPLTLNKLRRLDEVTPPVYELALCGHPETHLLWEGETKRRWYQTVKWDLVPQGTVIFMSLNMGISSVMQDLCVTMNITGPELEFWMDMVVGGNLYLEEKKHDAHLCADIKRIDYAEAKFDNPVNTKPGEEYVDKPKDAISMPFTAQLHKQRI